jgi:hypothetical protein
MVKKTSKNCQESIKKMGCSNGLFLECHSGETRNPEGNIVVTVRIIPENCC